MTFIEGIGDEVTAFFVIVFVIVLATLVTFIGSGAHLYSPVHTRAVTFALVSSREQTEEIAVQSTHPPNTSPQPPVDAIRHTYERLAADLQSATDSLPQEPTTQTTNAPPPTTHESASRTHDPGDDIDDPRVTAASRTHNLVDDNDDPRVTDDTDEEDDRVSADSGSDYDLTIRPTAPSERDVVRETQNGSQSSGIRGNGTQNTGQEGSQSSDAQGIRVRLKYLDDTERTVRSSPVVKIGDFKRNHFPEDLANNKVVRLIFCGHLLRDNSTLQSYRVIDNSVLHVQVLQAQSTDPGARSNAGQRGPPELLDLSHLLWPLVTLMLGICWACYIKYPEFFSIISLLLLAAFTASFFVIYRHVHQ